MKIGARKAAAFANKINFRKQGGLVPAIVEECGTGKVLMLAYMSREALVKTLTSGQMWYYSRSRRKLWRKGETSGNGQKLRAVAKDCDSDALLFKVGQSGPACHTGNKTCFYEPLGDGADFSLADLFSLIGERKNSDAKTSYTRKLLSNPNLLYSKVYEESAELVEAARKKPKKEVVWEAADLLYHIFVLLASKNVQLKEVEGELARRRKRE